MMTELIANFLYAQVENDVILVGFADDEFETKEYILLQKSLLSDEQDKELGFDKVHITYCDEDHSDYGGIQKFVLRNGVAEIGVGKKLADILETDEHIKVIFPKNISNLPEVEKHLREMFSEDIGVFISEV